MFLALPRRPQTEALSSVTFDGHTYQFLFLLSWKKQKDRSRHFGFTVDTVSMLQREIRAGQKADQ